LDTFLETSAQDKVNILEALRKNDIQAITHICASSAVFGPVPKESCMSGQLAQSWRRQISNSLQVNEGIELLKAR
jgi:hypothetical protein